MCQRKQKANEEIKGGRKEGRDGGGSEEIDRYYLKVKCVTSFSEIFLIRFVSEGRKCCVT